MIADDTYSLDSALLETLTRNLATLASVYHKPAEAFVRRARAAYEDEGEEEEEEIDPYAEEELSAAGAAAAAASGSGGAAGGGDLDLLGLGGGGGGGGSSSSGGGSSSSSSSGGLDDFFGGGSSAAPAAAAAASSLPLCGEKDGLAVHAGLSRKGGVPVLELFLVNKAGAAAVSACALKVNVNALGAAPASPAVIFSPIAVGSSGSASVPLSFVAAQFNAASASPEALQVALRDNASQRVVFFNVPLAPGFSAGFSPFVTDGGCDRDSFVATWRSLTEEHQAAEVAKELPSCDAPSVQQRLGRAKVTFVANRPGPDASIALGYFSAKGPDGSVFLVEVTFKQGFPAVKVVVKTSAGAGAAKLGLAGVVHALRSA